MKIVRSGVINGEQVEGRIETDAVPFMATITISGKSWFTQIFPTEAAAETAIIDTWNDLKKAEIQN